MPEAIKGTMIRTHGRTITDSYGPRESSNNPVPIESSSWLAALTPLGAPALRCQPYGVHYAFEECVLPLTNPRRFERPPALGEAHDWLRRLLGTVQRNGKPLKAEIADKLAAMLAPGPRRADGLPAYWPAARNVGQTQTWAAERQRDGFLGRAVLATVASDLQGLPLDHISSALLDLQDHRVPFGDGIIAGDPRRARAFQQEGRRLLADLGAWPWAHATAGRLPTGWRRSNAFLGPLQVWHESAVAEREEECRLAREAFAQPLY